MIDSAADDEGLAGRDTLVLGHSSQARAGRPLSWRTEARRQLTRRRTYGSMILVLALPPIIVAAFALGGDGSAGPQFVDLAQHGAANFVAFVLFVSASLLVAILGALFCGDTVPSEASWSSLRYLLTGPVPRARLLTSKMIVGLTTLVVAVVLLVGWSLLIGGLFYGWSPLESPFGGTIGWSGFAVRLLIITGYVIVTTLQVCAVAMWISTRTDAPLAAVGGAVMMVIVSSILDQIDALGRFRHALPMHFASAWTDLLQGKVDATDLRHGLLWSLLYAIVFGFLGYRRFLRSDVLS